MLQVRDLESRLSMGSKRVMELQGLVGELEGRLATEQSLNLSSLLGGDRVIHTPIAATSRQEENQLHTLDPAAVHVVQEPSDHASTDHLADSSSPALQQVNLNCIQLFN